MASRNQLWKVLRDLRGLAILGVVVAHGALRVLIARNLAGGLSIVQRVSSDTLWMILHDLMSYSVPLFFLLSGHFLGDSPGSWKAVWQRVRKLLYPYVFWSVCYYAVMWFEGHDRISIPEFLLQMAQGKFSVYWFVFLLMQYYVLARWLCPAVRRWPRASLAIALLLQTAVSVANYVSLHSFTTQALHGGSAPWLYPMSFAPSFAFYVVAGMWIRQNPEKLSALLSAKLTIVVVGAAVLISALLVAAEVLAFFNRLQALPGTQVMESLLLAFSHWKVSLIIFSCSAILLFLWIGRIWLPRWPGVTKLGTHGFAIYLTHMFFADLVFSALYHLYPPLLTNAAGFLISLALMLVPPILLAEVGNKLLPRVTRLLLGT